MSKNGEVHSTVKICLIIIQMEKAKLSIYFRRAWTSQFSDTWFSNSIVLTRSHSPHPLAAVPIRNAKNVDSLLDMTHTIRESIIGWDSSSSSELNTWRNGALEPIIHVSCNLSSIYGPRFGMFTIKTFKIKFHERLKFGYERETVWLSNHTTCMFQLNHSTVLEIGHLNKLCNINWS